MSHREAADTFGVSRGSIRKRLSGEKRKDAAPGRSAALTAEEANTVEDVLIWAANRYLGGGRLELRKVVLVLCNDGRLVPWVRAKGPGRKWLDL